MINKKRMEKMLVAADKALQSTGILKKNNEGVWLVDKSEYEAYLAGFGAIVINLSLIHISEPTRH